MQIKFSRIGTSLALVALFALAGTQASIAQSAPHETSLLGVTLLKSSYRDVLRRFGRPDEIQAGGPFMPSEGAPASRGSGASGGGGKTSSKSGFPGRGGTGTAGPGSGMSGKGGGMMQGMGMSSGKGGGGLPGFDLPAMGGSGQSMSGNPMGQDSGMMGGNSGGSASGQAAGGADASADQPEYESTWWYHDPMNAFHKSFLFNKDGRVIQIQEYGHDTKHKGGKTRKGVALGSGLNAVLQNYGWSNDAANSGLNMIMRFGGEDKVAFQLVNNKVVGITIAVVKDVAPAEAP